MSIRIVGLLSVASLVVSSLVVVACSSSDDTGNASSSSGASGTASSSSSGGGGAEGGASSSSSSSGGGGGSSSSSSSSGTASGGGGAVSCNSASENTCASYSQTPPNSTPTSWCALLGTDVPVAACSQDNLEATCAFTESSSGTDEVFYYYKAGNFTPTQLQTACDAQHGTLTMK